MKSRDFRTIKTLTIAGKRGTLKEHIHAPWFQFRKCNVTAKTADEAIAILTACAEKRATK